MKITRVIALPLLAASVVLVGGGSAHAAQDDRSAGPIPPSTQVIPSGLEFMDALLAVVQEVRNGIS